MSMYGFTPLAAEIIEDSMLPSLATRIVEDPEKHMGDLTYSMREEGSGSYDFEGNREQRIYKEAGKLIHSRLPSKFQAEAYQALHIEEEKPWTVDNGQMDGDERLFPVDQRQAWLPSGLLDRVVLSGAVTLEYAKTREVRNLLAQTQEGSLRSLGVNRVIALAGAYITNSVSGNGSRYLYKDYPYWTISEEEQTRTIYIGGDMHGDFRMHQQVQPNGTFIDPIGRPSEIMPLTHEAVLGYHSVEPLITAAILKQILHKQGPEGLGATLKDFKQTALLHFGGTDAPNLGPMSGFADYGSNDFSNRHLCSEVRSDIEDPEPDTGMHDVELPFLPGVDVLLIIHPSQEGLEFYNHQPSRGDPEFRITVPNSEFTKLFEALLLQSALGLGRTAVYEHLNLIRTASDALTNVGKKQSSVE